MSLGRVVPRSGREGGVEGIPGILQEVPLVLGELGFFARRRESVGGRERFKVLLASFRNERDEDGAFTLLSVTPRDTVRISNVIVRRYNRGDSLCKGGESGPVGQRVLFRFLLVDVRCSPSVVFHTDELALSGRAEMVLKREAMAINFSPSLISSRIFRSSCSRCRDALTVHNLYPKIGLVSRPHGRINFLPPELSLSAREDQSA